MKYQILLILSINCCFFVSKAQAFKLTPMNIYLSNKKDKEVVTLSNAGNNKKLFIKIYATTRDINENAEEHRNITDDFLIYPPQLILGANETRNIRVSYKGNKDNKFEKAYRLIAKELPIDREATKDNKTGIKILLKYSAALYFSPGKARSDIKVKSVKKSLTKKDHYEFVLENIGTKHEIIKSIRFFYKNPKKKHHIFLKNPKEIIGKNFLSKGKYRFLLKSNIKGEIIDYKRIKLKINE